MALLYRVENTGLTTYNNFTFTDNDSIVKIINLEPNQVYYINSWSITSPSPEILVTSMSTPSFVMEFEGCCDNNQQFSFYGINYSGPQLEHPFKNMGITDTVSFGNAISSSNPSINYQGCFQYVGSATTINSNYPLFSTISFPTSFISTGTFGDITASNIDTCEKCLLTNPCPPSYEVVYFKYCCPHSNLSSEYFGLTVPVGTTSLGSTYDVQLPSISGCATSVRFVTIPSTEQFPIYEVNYTLVQYEACTACTATTLNCIQTPTVTPTIYYTADTRCGATKSYRNECDPITIFPLGVECNSTNPTNTTISDGIISLIITGGTPPYTVTWDNGSSGPYLQNLSFGSYTSTVTDYYGDFTAITTCTLTAETPTSTPLPTPTPTPTPCVNQVDNGDFKNSLKPWISAWDLGWRWSSFNGGSAEYIGADDYTHLTQPNSLIIGCTYQIDYDVYNNTNDGYGYIRPWAGTSGTGNDVFPLGYSHQTFTLTCTDNTNFYFEGFFNGAGSLILDNVVVCQIECGTPPLPSSRYCFRVYIKKNGVVFLDDYIQFFLSDTINGYTSWVSIDGEYQLSWSTVLNGWELTSVNNLFGCTIFNPSTQNPPVNSYVFYGADNDSYVRADIGGCEKSGLCATIISSCGTEVIQMTTGGTMSGELFYSGNYPCGNTGSWVILYNPNTSRWETSGLTNVYGFTSESWSNTSVGNLNWNGSGGYSLQTTLGVCNNSSQMVLNVTTNNPTNGNNGSITVNVTGGLPGYTYSIDGGNTYYPFPIFNGLSAGNYTVFAKDSNGTTQSTTVTLTGGPTTTYSVGIVTSQTTPGNTSTQTNKVYTSNIRVTPQLPAGAVITFDLIHNNMSRTAPSSNSAIMTSNSTLVKDSVTQTITSNTSVTGTTPNSATSCQNTTIYYTGKTESWNNVTYNVNTNLVLTTTTTITQNLLQNCYLGTSFDTFTIANLTISGCSGCSVINLT